MSKALIINAHYPSGFSSGSLNGSLVERAKDLLEQKGYEMRTQEVVEDWDTEEQLANHR